jgi:hypothetical protein
VDLPLPLRIGARQRSTTSARRTANLRLGEIAQSMGTSLVAGTMDLISRN